MIGVREAVEQAIYTSLGAAALTKERAESIVADLVSRGYMGAEDGLVVVARLMGRIRGEGAPTQTGLMGRLEGGAQAAFHGLGLARASDIDDIRLRLAELEHRVGRLESTPDA